MKHHLITGRTFPALPVAVWVVLVCCGTLSLVDYSTRPGDSGNVRNHWPADTIAFEDGAPNILLFLHPRCPCSRASVKQFRELTAALRQTVHVIAVVRSSPEFEDLNVGTDLRSAVGQIPGIHVTRDADGSITKKFGVATSGHVLLFASDQRLLFSGGITESRGHEGDNYGARLVARALSTAGGTSSEDPMPATASRSCVYGCALHHHHEKVSQRHTP